MKKRNNKILLATIALSVNATFNITPFATTAYAVTIPQSDAKLIDVKLDSKNNFSSENSTYTIKNTGDTINLSEVKLRYYFKSDENTDGQDFKCYYGAISGDNGKNTNITDYVHGNIIKLDKPVENADSYVEISFDEKAGTFDSSDMLALNTSINNNDWSKMNSDDDYSFNDATKTVVLINDEVVSGIAPLSKEDQMPKVTLGGVTIKGGEEVRVPIGISNIKKMGVSKFHIKVSYDPNVFEFGGCISNSPTINALGYDVETGKWHNREEHTVDIGYDFTKSKTTKALYEEGDYTYLPLKAINNVEDGLSYFKVVVEPTLTDANGKEYSGDDIAIDNQPITLKYNKDAIKDSSISQNYLTFDESNVKDTDILMKKYENTVTSIECSSDDSDSSTLKSGTDFDIVDNTLTLKESFLKTLIGKNAYVTINFDKGISQTIFINNTKLNAVSDPLRSGINSDEANISLGNYTPTNTFMKTSPLSFAITNTSNTDMDLNKLNLTYYYTKYKNEILDDFKLDYCSIIGSNKDLRPSSISECRPIYCDWYYNKRCYFEESFNKNAGILKPGETLFFRGHLIEQKDFNIRKSFQEPLVTYDGESLYGEIADEYKEDSKILSDDILLDPKKITDTPIELKLNSNALKSIEEYSEGTLIKTLKRGTDYILNKRNEVILTKSYLDSVKNNITLNLKFSSGHDDSINIKAMDNSNLPDGSLTIENKASIGYGETGLCGGTYRNRWDKLTVPIVLKDLVDGKVNSSCIILKFNKYLFDDVTVEHYITPDAVGLSSIANAEVNYELGIIKIELNNYIYKTSDAPDFGLIFTPNGNTDPQKIDLTLDSDSYYETESGDRYKPVFKYNDIKLVSKNEEEYDSNK